MLISSARLLNCTVAMSILPKGMKPAPFLQSATAIIAAACQRAAELEAPGLVVEFETLPPMSENPAWGIELTRILLDGMAEARRRHGLKSVLRVTPNDTREMERPPRMRSGKLYEAMMQTFDGGATEWNALIQQLPSPHLLQTWEWAQVKASLA